MDKLQRLIKGKIPGEATGIEVRKSVCTICDPTTQCGLDCYVKDGRIIKVEGSLENPHSAGTLCCKGAAQRQWLYHEDRMRTPLKRVGPRGSSEFVPISWAEALDTVAENLQRLKAESGPESVVFYCGYPKQLRPFLQRLALLYGSPNYCTESSSCFTAMMMGWKLVYGSMAGPDIANTKCLAGLDRQRVMVQRSHRAQVDGRAGAGREDHRHRPAQLPHRRHRRPASQAAPGHRRRPRPSHGQRDHLRGPARP